MKSRIKLIGVDLGFGFVKAYDGQRPVIMPSALAENGRGADDGPSDRLAPALGVAMEVDGAALFVGQQAASDWRAPQRPRRSERLFSEFGQRLVLAVLGSYAERENPLHVVLGLPLSHFQRLKTAFEARLLGYHRTVWRQPDDSRIPKNIHIRRIHTVAHPMGTFSGLVMDEDGHLRQEGFADLKIALVDIGFRSTNVMLMDRLQFSNRCSGTIELGVSRGFELIDRKLRRESGARPSFEVLYQAVRLGHIRITDQTYNLERLREEAFRQVAVELADNITHLLAPAWDLDRLLLTGGGARELSAFIGPLLPGDVSQIENEQDARLNNAQGQWRLARSLWGASGLCDPGG
jgi:plasmid segregation protein ParM